MISKSRIAMTMELQRPNRQKEKSPLCPHCQRKTFEYPFMADGVRCCTYHCTRHGDVIPKGISDETISRAAKNDLFK